MSKASCGQNKCDVFRLSTEQQDLTTVDCRVGRDSQSYSTLHHWMSFRLSHNYENSDYWVGYMQHDKLVIN